MASRMAEKLCLATPQQNAPDTTCHGKLNHATIVLCARWVRAVRGSYSADGTGKHPDECRGESFLPWVINEVLVTEHSAKVAIESS